MERKFIYVILSVIILTLAMFLSYTYIFSDNDNDLPQLSDYEISDYEMDGNTVIQSPLNNSEVSGTVDIITYVETCNCTGKTKLYVDGTFINYGIGDSTEYMIVFDGQWVEVFHNEWDTTEFENGPHEIEMLGKHDEYGDKITLIVNN